METYKSTQEDEKRVETYVGGIPKQVEQRIDYLNNITKRQLEELQITNRKWLIKVAMQMIMKQNLLKRTQNNIRALADAILAFKNMFNEVIKLWLLHPWDKNGEIYTKE